MQAQRRLLWPELWLVLDCEGLLRLPPQAPTTRPRRSPYSPSLRSTGPTVLPSIPITPLSTSLALLLYSVLNRPALFIPVTYESSSSFLNCVFLCLWKFFLDFLPLYFSLISPSSTDIPRHERFHKNSFNTRFVPGLHCLLHILIIQ